MEGIDFIESMKVLKLEPSDIIVLKTAETLSMEMINILKRQVEKVTKSKILILQGDMDIGVLRNG